MPANISMRKFLAKRPRSTTGEMCVLSRSNRVPDVGPFEIFQSHNYSKKRGEKVIFFPLGVVRVQPDFFVKADTCHFLC